MMSRAIVVCAIGLAFMGIVVEPTHADDASELRSWLTQAPPHFRRLIEAGQVQLEYDDAALKEKGKLAMTLFQYNVQQRPKYQINPQGRDAEGMLRVFISVSFPATSYKVQHKIVLPSSFRPSSPWDTPVMRHEMDHVAISTDPRIKRLIEIFLWKDQSWVESFPLSTPPTPADIEQSIQTRLSANQKTIERLVQQAYDRLDEASQNGQQSIAERTKFFESLYDEKTIEASSLAISDDQRRQLRSPRFRDLARHYSLLLP